MEADADVERQVLDAFDDFWDAWAKQDLARFLKRLAHEPGLIMFGTGADEKRLGLRAWIVQVERDWSQSTAAWAEFAWRAVCAVGEVAWVSAEGSANWRTEEGGGTVPIRITAIFVKRDGNWLMAHLHGSVALPAQEEGQSFPTSIDAVAAAVDRERPDLRARAAPDGTITLLFTDIEGSTAINERLGDQRWLELLRAHNAIIRERVEAHGGYEVKTSGDGFMIAFSSARRAVHCAMDIQRDVAALSEAHPEEPIRVRAGLHTGEPIREADDFFGKHVALAARIAGEARGGEILVSALLRELTESAGDIRFGSGRSVELKGLSGTHQVYDVRWQET